ncbi:hypothetical protein Acr_24g0005350 [Actinidia rufa]|uniref:Uncharacterized protein n=1 Tax=Actinidia rufa TaxID=165716 RepID=A0A7J0GU28_9ERIC|nr:hypothetical protein Acr_24g0005350 [Actinidia rufa]
MRSGRVSIALLPQKRRIAERNRKIFQNSVCNRRMLEETIASLIAFNTGLVCKFYVGKGEFAVCWSVGALSSSETRNLLPPPPSGYNGCEDPWFHQGCSEFVTLIG